MAADHTLFDPELVIARLAAITPAGTFRAVLGAADLLSALQDLKQSPAAFVVPITDDAGPNVFASAVVGQRVTARFGVVIAEQNLRDPRGQESLKGMRTLRLAVMAQLHGWQPNVNYDAIEFAGGRVFRMDLEQQVLWWQDNYRTVTDVRTT